VVEITANFYWAFLVTTKMTTILNGWQL